MGGSKGHGDIKAAMRRGQHRIDWVPSMKIAPAMYESFGDYLDQSDFELGNYTKLTILKIYKWKQNNILA